MPDIAKQLVVLSTQVATPIDFVSYWSRLYRDPREELYDVGIQRPLTAEKVRALYIWKNGGPLSKRKAESVEKNFIALLPDALALDPVHTSAESFLNRFQSGGAIWRIFWLHCWSPERFPIFDVHVHRVMVRLEEAELSELARYDDKKKVDIYLKRYLPFFRQFSGVSTRAFDRACWTLGKFLRDYGGAISFDGDHKKEKNHGGGETG